MKRIAITIACILVAGAPALAAAPGGREEFNVSSQKTALSLRMESLLVDSDGIHPLHQASFYDDPVEIGKGGSFKGTVFLGKDRDSRLIYVLAYRPTPNGQIRLNLQRSLHRNEKEAEALPDITHLMDPVEAWTVTVLEDKESRSEVRLRVVPIIRPAVENVPLDSDRLKMWLQGGPLIQYNASAEEDRVIFRAVNIKGGRTLRFGIPGAGEIRLGLAKLPGTAPCGFVRGHLLQFFLGGHIYAVYSEREILPDDPSRPGGGWTIYGAIDPEVRIEQGKEYYGGAQP